MNWFWRLLTSPARWLEPRYRYDVALVFWLTCKDAKERGR